MDILALHGVTSGHQGVSFNRLKLSRCLCWVLPTKPADFIRLEQVVRRTAAKVLASHRVGNQMEDEIVSDVLFSLEQEPEDADIRDMRHIAAFRAARHAVRLIKKRGRIDGVEPDVLSAFPGEKDPERNLVYRDLVTHIDRTRMKMPRKERQAFDRMTGLLDGDGGPTTAAERQALRMARRRLAGYEPD